MTLTEALNAKRPFFAPQAPDEVFTGLDDHGGILKLVVEAGGYQRVTLPLLLFADYQLVEPKVTITKSEFWAHAKDVFGHDFPNMVASDGYVFEFARRLGLEDGEDPT